jgi:transglutaminase-like putative cysteine protease
MRIQVDYVTRYEYEAPARLIQQLLRLTPRPFEGLHVREWRLDIDADGRLRGGEDALGNLTHTLSVAGPVERFPPLVFLRDTPLTHADARLQAFAAEVRAMGDTPLKRMHALLTTVHERVEFDCDPTDVATSAAEAFAINKGVCQDLAHIFIACARAMGLPARYVSGHLARSDGQIDQAASHAWCEAYVEDLGWVGFDPANGISPTEAYVRVAIGLDYLGAAPVRGSRYGGEGERMDVKLRVTPAGQ